MLDAATETPTPVSAGAGRKFKHDDREKTKDIFPLGGVGARNRCGEALDGFGRS